MNLSKLGIFKKNKEKKPDPETNQENTTTENKETIPEPQEENTTTENNQTNPEPLPENSSITNQRVIKLNKLSCPSCGAPVEIEKGKDMITCPFCRTEFEVTEENPDFIIDRGVLERYNGTDPEIKVPSGVTSIGLLAFSNKNTLTKIVLPEGVTELEGGFFNCENLETIILPESLEEIPDDAFSQCISLKSITLPKNLKYLGDRVFYGCKSLKSIEIPPNVKFVETITFGECENLETISCYENTEIDGEYFMGCPNLSSINILDSKTNKVISKKKIIDTGNNYHYKIK